MIIAPFPTATNLPTVTTAQMIEVDRRMTADVGISLFQMMENAGLQLANVARELFLDGDVAGKRVAVLVGAGGNGGGAIVAARRLVNWGARCDIGLSRSDGNLSEVAQAQLDILRNIAPITRIDPATLNKDYDLVIDGLIGYSLSGSPRGRAAEFIVAANSTKTPVLSLDVPSGFDGATGETREPCIMANTTMTIALPKLGMTCEKRSRNVGRLLCADISCPSAVFENLGLIPIYNSPFSVGPLVELI